MYKSGDYCELMRQNRFLALFFLASRMGVLLGGTTWASLLEVQQFQQLNVDLIIVFGPKNQRKLLNSHLEVPSKIRSLRVIVDSDF